jgi:hypothetical protein
MRGAVALHRLHDRGGTAARIIAQSVPACSCGLTLSGSAPGPSRTSLSCRLYHGQRGVCPLARGQRSLRWKDTPPGSRAPRSTTFGHTSAPRRTLARAAPPGAPSWSSPRRPPSPEVLGVSERAECRNRISDTLCPPILPVAPPREETTLLRADRGRDSLRSARLGSCLDRPVRRSPANESRVSAWPRGRRDRHRQRFSDGFADNFRLFLPATQFSRFAVTREINDGLIAPRFSPSPVPSCSPESGCR